METMKLNTLIPAIVFPLMLSAAAKDSGEALHDFAGYEQGRTLALLIDTRRAVFRDTTDELSRAQRERELLAFIASDAHPQAKAIAIDWLGCLGSPASLPALAAAGKDPALAEPAAAAGRRISGPAAPAENQPATPGIHKNAAEVAAFNSAIDADASSPAADDRITAAMSSPNDLLAGAALRRIRAGAGTAALPSKLLASLEPFPPCRHFPLCEALASRPYARDALRPILHSRLKADDPETRAAAILTLGRILHADELPLLLGFLTDTRTPELTTAAKAALLRATDPEIDPQLIRMAQSETPIRIAAIDALAARHAQSAIDPLWSLTSSRDPQVSAAAYKALGSLIPPDHLNQVAGKFTAAHDSPSRSELGKLLWNLVRRHPDPGAAAQVLDAHADLAPVAIKQQLARYAERIRPDTSAPKDPSPESELPNPDDRTLLLPDGYEQVAYLDCGAAAPVLAGNFSLRRTAGRAHAFGHSVHPLATVDTGESVTYEISGLETGADYVIGFSAWDADLAGRIQSFSVNDTILLDRFAPIAYHGDRPTCARIHLPLPARLATDGKITVQTRSVAGPNAVISELWLLRRKTGTAARKHILILTGDDYQAHRWRETGPAFAAILRADPQLEVTLSESPFLLGSPVLRSYDAVFLHFKNYRNRLATEESLWKNLEAFVHDGGGLVIAHFGCGALQEWNGFVKLAGRVWNPDKRGHDPHGEFLVRVLQPGHPATKGIGDFTTRDELYTCLDGETRIEVLAEATSKVDQSVHPVAIALTPGKGRVFLSPLGHDLGALQAPGTRALYLQGTRWAAGIAEKP